MTTRPYRMAVSASIRQIGGTHNGRTHRPYRPTVLDPQGEAYFKWLPRVVGAVLLIWWVL